ncbi:DMT family transporter [Curvivirga aplysinae]|uniref:DMT family transporter n=1 Tax=Curvivirga aplysinae TaxID=2529852 RepID=UPI0012BD672E|nr:DMT family transporter [Curvivirga aplysinae]MTI09845.1 DMT family transporter [Curvivirga aplysinae]
MIFAKHNLSENITGMIWMLAAVLLFSAMHAMIRIASHDVDILVVVFFRNFFGMFVLVPLLFKHGLTPLKTKRPGMLLWRAILNSGAMTLYFTALAVAPLADVTALSFLGPIFATVLAILMFKEQVGYHRWFAIIIGFIGALIILRPGMVEIDTGSILVIIASVLWAGALMVIKLLSRTESSLTITFYMTIMMTPLTLIPALFVWSWPSAEGWLWLLGIGLLGTIAQYAMTESLRLGDTHVVMPMDYTRLIWLAILGWLLFAEEPDFYTIIGGIVIAFSASYIAWRESRKPKKTAEIQA